MVGGAVSVLVGSGVFVNKGVVVGEAGLAVAVLVAAGVSVTNGVEDASTVGLEVAVCVGVGIR